MIKEIISTNRKQGHEALICICSAHKDVIKAAFSYLKKNPTARFSIESTVQQVNQDGGYTGMKPADFAKMVRDIAGEYGISEDSYVLAGDHLGPNVWKKLPSAQAMEKSLILIQEYVKAGYTKLHIDPSMACADDTTPLSVENIALRTAEMIKVAEETASKLFGNSDSLFYIVGTEVPVPGGAQEFEDHVMVTPLSEVDATISIINKHLVDKGLDHVWQRVHGLVVQPGVEFGDEFVAPYTKNQASGLFKALEHHPQMVFEAHSTDYQTQTGLKDLVNDHFAILKVGPELTFAWREALLALDMIDKERNPNHKSLRALIEKEMVTHPNYWKDYYQDTEAELGYKRIFSLSDRIRYYWASPILTEAVATAISQWDSNLNYAMISQYLPWVLDVTDQRSNFSAQDILILSVERIINKYYQATRG
ncbi:MAG: class II D-tagatose-bisphosphate aldolase non-catalytic subunit [Brevinema sp.]